MKTAKNYIEACLGFVIFLILNTMKWTDVKIWKQSIIATFICLIGGSIGTMGITFYLIKFNWFFVSLISVFFGIITCIFFMIIWNMAFRNISFIESVKISFKIGIVSLLILILTENFIVFYITSKLISQNIHVSAMHNLLVTIIAMSCGFFLTLPYNYYQLKKTEKYFTSRT